MLKIKDLKKYDNLNRLAKISKLIDDTIKSK